MSRALVLFMAVMTGAWIVTAAVDALAGRWLSAIWYVGVATLVGFPCVRSSQEAFAGRRDPPRWIVDAYRFRRLG